MRVGCVALAISAVFVAACWRVGFQPQDLSTPADADAGLPGVRRDGPLDSLAAVDAVVDRTAPDLVLVHTCSDGSRNGTETDVDCGGDKCAACAHGKGCLLPADCAIGICTGGKCGVVCASAAAFQGQSSLAVGTYPRSVISGDFNADGKVDLAVANQATNDVSVLLGQGDGSFAAAVHYAAGPLDGAPWSVITADFNGDGKVDLGIASYTYGLSVLLGKGDGSFQAPLNTVAQNGYLNSLTAGDFDRDGHLDLATGGNGNFSVSVLLGQGNGTFQTEVIYSLSGALPVVVTSGDFNGDGKLDLATGNGISDNLSVLLGSGNGSFLAAVHYALGANAAPASLTSGDFNGDGKLDLAVAESGYPGAVSVLLGNGDGSFQPAVDFAAGTNPTWVTTGDFNGDGKLDLALASGDAKSSVVVLLGNGNGSFKAAATFGTAIGLAYSVTTGDFNGDGRLDLAVADFAGNRVTVHLNQCQ